MSNDYRMTNTRGQVRHTKSRSFDGFPAFPRNVCPDQYDNANFDVRNAAELFAYRTGCPVLVVDETDGFRFVGIYGATCLQPATRYPWDPPGLYRWVTDDVDKVAEWLEWAAEHALDEALIWAPYEGEDRAFRLAKNHENQRKAIVRRYDLLLRAAKVREGTDAPPMTPELIAARDAARRARDALSEAAA